MEKCESLFSQVVKADAALNQVQGDNQHDTEAGVTSAITLNKKALRKVLLAHEKADLSEMFRLWLSAQGLRFPTGFFYGQKEPAHVKIPCRVAYRRRSIVKFGNTIRICEFATPEEALKFVSCGSKEKGN